MSREAKIRYTCIKPLSTFSKIFTLEEIEQGKAKQWMDINVVFMGDLHKDFWTGLQDKNGTDIYEHDILQYSYNKDTKTKETFTEIVEWDDMSEYSGFTIHKGMEFEVIGNKHTHPELINTQV